MRALRFLALAALLAPSLVSAQEVRSPPGLRSSGSGDASALSVTAQGGTKSLAAWFPTFATVNALGVLNVVPPTNTPGTSDAGVFPRVTVAIPRFMSRTDGEFALTVQGIVPVTNSPSAYEKGTIYGRIIQNDPSDYTAGATILRDAVVYEGQATIAAGNMSGRAWVYSGFTTIPSGADGYALGLEIGVNNSGVDQPLIAKHNSKNGMNIFGGGTLGGTAALHVDGKWHQGIVFPSNAVTDYAFSITNGVSNLAYLDPAGNFYGQTYRLASGGAVKSVSGGATAGLVLDPGGNGGISAQAPDGTNAGGLARGANSVDFQQVRDANFKRAAGVASVIGGGQNNVAPGAHSTIAGGLANNAGGQYSFAAGSNADTRNDYAKLAYGSNKLGSQWGVQTVRNTATAAAQVRLTADGNNATTTNVTNIPDNTDFTLRVTLTARSVTTPGNDYSAVWNGAHILDRKTGAGTVTVNGSTATVAPDFTRMIGTATGASSVILADPTNGGLNVSFTPPSGNTDTWNISAKVETTEVQ